MDALQSLGEIDLSRLRTLHALKGPTSSIR
jgi:hypothetical protein